MAPLWQVLVGGEAVRRHAHLILGAGVALALLGVAVMIDALAGAVHIPERWFGLLLLVDAVGSLGAGLIAAGAARRLRIFKGLFLALAAILIMMASASSFFLLAMLFGTVFLVDGTIRIVLAYLLKFPEWRTSVALGALGVAFGVFHLQPWPTWYVGTVGYCIGMFLVINGLRLTLAGLRTPADGAGAPAGRRAGVRQPDRLCLDADRAGHDARHAAAGPALRRLRRCGGAVLHGHAALEQGGGPLYQPLPRGGDRSLPGQPPVEPARRSRERCRRPFPAIASRGG